MKYFYTQFIDFLGVYGENCAQKNGNQKYCSHDCLSLLKSQESPDRGRLARGKFDGWSITYCRESVADVG
jgi:hypothetical protein